MTKLCWLHEDDLWFPPATSALTEPNGLLAVGGDLSPERLLRAYSEGIFPWYSDDQPILWWSPNPRCLLFPEELHISRSLRRTLRVQRFIITIDQAFEQVIHACGATREHTTGTWITPEMEAAYCELHRQGIAHSFEAWHAGQLVGGLYGLAMGRCFFGESMFSTMTDASKVVFVHVARQLEQWGYAFLDCQVESPHVLSLGARCIPRDQFLSILKINRSADAAPHRWELNWHYTT